MNRKISKRCFYIFATSALILLSNASLAATQEPVHALQFFKMIAGLIFVIGSIAAMAWMYRRFSGFSTSSNRNIRLESVLTLGNKEKLIVVQTDQHRLLIGVTANQINALMELDPREVQDPPAKQETDFENSSGFAGILKRLSTGGSNQ